MAKVSKKQKRHLKLQKRQLKRQEKKKLWQMTENEHQGQQSLCLDQSRAGSSHTPTTQSLSPTTPSYAPTTSSFMQTTTWPRAPNIEGPNEKNAVPCREVRMKPTSFPKAKGLARTQKHPSNPYEEFIIIDRAYVKSPNTYAWQTLVDSGSLCFHDVKFENYKYTEEQVVFRCRASINGLPDEFPMACERTKAEARESAARMALEILAPLCYTVKYKSHEYVSLKEIIKLGTAKLTQLPEDAQPVTEMASDDSPQGESYNNTHRGESYDNTHRGESYDNTCRRESYDNTHRRESYDNTHRGESYDYTCQGESYDNTRQRESYENPHQEESYENPHQEESYENPHQEESYENPHQEESYENPHQDESYGNTYREGERINEHVRGECSSNFKRRILDVNTDSEESTFDAPVLPDLDAKPNLDIKEPIQPSVVPDQFGFMAPRAKRLQYDEDIKRRLATRLEGKTEKRKNKIMNRQKKKDRKKRVKMTERNIKFFELSNELLSGSNIHKGYLVPYGPLKIKDERFKTGALVIIRHFIENIEATDLAFSSCLDFGQRRIVLRTAEEYNLKGVTFGLRNMKHIVVLRARSVDEFMKGLLNSARTRRSVNYDIIPPSY